MYLVYVPPHIFFLLPLVFPNDWNFFIFMWCRNFLAWTSLCFTSDPCFYQRLKLFSLSNLLKLFLVFETSCSSNISIFTFSYPFNIFFRFFSNVNLFLYIYNLYPTICHHWTSSFVYIYLYIFTTFIFIPLDYLPLHLN